MTKFRSNGDSVEKFDVSSWYNLLGMQYNPSTDSIRLKLSAIDCDIGIVTKRKVLSITASVFDRIGVVAPRRCLYQRSY